MVLHRQRSAGQARPGGRLAEDAPARLVQGQPQAQTVEQLRRRGCDPGGALRGRGGGQQAGESDDVNVAVVGQGERQLAGVPGHPGAFGAGQRPAHAHEPARDHRPALPGRPVPLERDRALRAPQVERDDDPAAGDELFPPGGGQVTDPDRCDDPVVRGAGRVSGGAVGRQHGHVRVPGRSQVRPGLVRDVLVQIHRDHRAGGPDKMGQHGCVVPGAGPDLQHPLTRRDVELVQHVRHDRRLGGRAGGLPVGAAPGDDRLVPVGQLGIRPRQEQVPGHRAHGLGHGVTDRPAAGCHLADHAAAEPAQVSAVHGAARRPAGRRGPTRRCEAAGSGH